MSWRDSIKPIKKAIVRPHWKNTIRPEIKPAKDFVFEEHEKRIFGYIKRYLDSIRDSLKLKFSDLTEAEKKSLKGPKGDSIKGDKGDDGISAQRWHVFEKIDNEQGKEGDLALHTKTYEILEKHEGKWIAISAFKLPKNQTMVTGGVSEQFVIDYVASNGGGGGSTSQIISSTTSSITLTNQDIIIAKGTNPLTITLKNANDAEKSVVVKNKTNQTLTINVDGGALIDDDATWEISPNTAFEFFPQGGQYYVY